MTRFLLFIKALLLLATVASAAPPPGWTYLGAFRLPTGSDYNTFDYAGANLAYNPANNSLFVSGHDQANRIAEVSIPTPSTAGSPGALPRATYVQPFNDLHDRLPNKAIPDWMAGGLLVHANYLVGTEYSFYENRTLISQSHWRLPGTTLAGSPTGLFSVGLKSQPPRLDIAGGYMANIPASQQADYGGPALTGLSAVAIISGTSVGPAVQVFNPDQLGPSTAATSYASATPLVYYPESNPLTPWNSSNTPYFNGTSEIRGVMMEQDGDVLFWGSHGTGPFFYGSLNDGRGESTTHAAPYRYQFWRYSKADMLAVKNGTKQPWQVQPLIDDVSMPFQTSARYAGGMAYDQANGRVYVAARKCDGPAPIIHVFQATSAPPADTTAPIITNIAVASVTETTATITWTTDEASDSRVEYGLTPSYGTIIVDQADVTQHSMTVTGLSPATLYNFRVKSWDASNNSTTSSYQEFRTATPPDPCAALRAERDALAAQVADLQSQVAALTAANAALTQQVVDLQAELDAANQKIANAQAALE